MDTKQNSSAMMEDASMKQLTNGELTIKVAQHGAELSSIQYQGEEYLWQADPAFWKRHSPVLFPIVGAVWDGTYRVNGKEYHLSQHGFARDRDFTLLSVSDDEIWYQLKSDAESLQNYPFQFVLEIGYKLEGKQIRVMWRVKNPSDETLSFQIGAHPAFYYRGEAQQDVKGYVSFDRTEDLKLTIIREKGCVDKSEFLAQPMPADGLLPIGEHTFDLDALIFENHQLRGVTLHDAQQKPFLKLTFDTPVVGLWAPSAQSPFVCIEPWYGRCDEIRYAGDYRDKEWINTLEAGRTFEGGYSIELI